MYTKLHDSVCSRVGAPLILKEHNYPGALITFCGIDGSGKTSLMSRISEYISSLGHKCYSTFTPTKKIRSNPLFRKQVDAPDYYGKYDAGFFSLCLLVLSDLLIHVEEEIEPRLKNGEIVLCDRYIFTNIGEITTRSDSEDLFAAFYHAAKQIIKQDLGILLDVPPELAIKRVRQRIEERDKPIDTTFVDKQAMRYHDVGVKNDLLVVSTEYALNDTFAQLKPEIDKILMMKFN